MTLTPAPVIQGDTFSFSLTAVDQNDIPINLTGATVGATLLGGNAALDLTEYANGSVMITDAVNGAITVTVSSVASATCTAAPQRDPALRPRVHVFFTDAEGWVRTVGIVPLSPRMV